VGEVGKWLPWDPEPNDVSEQEYAEEQLNTLMKNYKENEEQREQFQKEQRAKAAAKKPLADANASETFSGMFGSSGPPDLAIARKTDLSGNN
jgi:hypothetical protein